MTETTILIVEDEEIVAMDIKNMLCDLGYNVQDIARSEEEVIQKIEKEKPDLLLMDIMLGEGGDGIKIAEQVKSRYKIPVIYLTAYADEGTLDRAKLTSPYGYIIKPFREKELHTAIIMALSRRDMTMKIKQETENALAAIIGSAELMLDEGHQVHKKESITKLELIKKAAYVIKGFVDKL